jgi:phage terminase small subunit
MKEDNTLTLLEIRERIAATTSRMSVPHKRFADEYMANGQNATQAYMAIFKRIKNGKIASAAACRIMKRHDIKAYIELCKQFTTDELLTHMTVSKTRVLDEEAKLAFLDFRKMFDIEGELLPPKYWPEEIARAASSIDIDQRWDEATQKWTYKYKIKFNDKGRALQRLETVLGMNKAPDLSDDTANLFKSFLTSIDGDSRGKLPAEMEDDE